MALPTGFNSRQPTGRRTFRFFASGSVTTNDFADKAFLFTENSAANVTPLPVVTASPDSATPTAVVVPNVPTGQGQNDGPSPAVPLIYSGTIRIFNDETSGGNDLEFSFDGTNVHGRVKAGEQLVYRNRIESGIALKSPAAASVAFRVEAW